MFQSSELKVIMESQSPSPILRKYPLDSLESNSPISMINSDSPILCYTRKRQLESPILSCTQNRQLESPILDDKRYLKKTKKRTKDDYHIEDSPPDIFSQCEPQKIEESYSPNVKNDVETFIIDIVNSQDSVECPKVKLEPSDIKETSACYHQPKRKKKQCKPGGLLHQIEKTSHLQASRISLWHYDIYSNKIDILTLKHIKCLVKKEWKEYGCKILECCTMNSDSEEQILVCLGHNMKTLHDTQFLGKTIKVFQPFKQKLIKHENKDVNFYYNITRILS